MVGRNPATASKGPLPVLHADSPGFDAAFERLRKRGQERADEIEKNVRKIVERVRDGGDAELIACVRKFDGSRVDKLEVTRAEFERAAETIDPADRAALGKAA